MPSKDKAPKPIPKVKLIPLSGRTSNGRYVGERMLAKIYSNATEEDKEFFDPPTEQEISATTIKYGRSWFAIENKEGKIVGATSVHFNAVKYGWKTFNKVFGSMQGWLGRIFIIPQFRGQKYDAGTKSQIIRLAKEKGLPELYGLIYEGNIRSIKGKRKADIVLDEEKMRKMEKYRYNERKKWPTMREVVSAALQPLSLRRSIKRFKENFKKEKKRGSFVAVSRKIRL